MGFRSTSSSHAKALEIGERIKQARLNKDLTQVEISEISGLERRAIINAEKGKVTGKSDRIFGCSKHEGPDRSVFTAPTNIANSTP